MRIAGIGNALLDLFWFPDTEAAPVLGLHPNSTVHTDPDRMDELLLGVPAPIQVSGGSAANALKAASLLGEDCVFFGCLGSFEREYDPWAKAFLADLSDYGVRPCAKEEVSNRALPGHQHNGASPRSPAPPALLLPSGFIKSIAINTSRLTGCSSTGRYSETKRSSIQSSGIAGLPESRSP